MSFLTTEDGQDFLELIPNDLFISAEHIFMLSVLKKYNKEYSVIPKQENVLPFILKQENVSDNIDEGLLEEIVSDVFKMRNEYKFERDFLVLEIKKHSFKQLAIKHSNIEKLQPDDFSKMASDMRKIELIGEKFYIDRVTTFTDFQGVGNSLEGIPSPYACLNAYPAAGGFLSPEIIVIAAKDKIGKTWFMISLALHYAKLGLKVVYVDYENGKEKIKRRMIQHYLKMGYDDIRDPNKLEIINQELNKFKELFPDIHIIKLDAYKDGVLEAEPFLDEINPDVTFYDDMDIMGHRNKKLDKRLKIQRNYFEAKSLNTKYKSFAITVSKLNKEGDYAEDRQKSANADCILRIDQTEQEEAKSIFTMSCDFIREGENTIKSGIKGIFKSNLAWGDFQEISISEYDRTIDEEWDSEKDKVPTKVLPKIIVEDE